MLRFDRRNVAYCGHVARVSSTVEGKSGVTASVSMVLSMDVIG